MKETKKSIKFLFGSEQAGMDYLKAIAKGGKAPVLFLQGPLADEMATWIGNIGGGGSNISLGQLGTASSGLVIVKNAGDVSDTIVTAALDARKRGANVIIATDRPIKAIDYVKDPSFIRLYAEDVSMAPLMAEAASTRQALMA